jgi:hypothetical protein
VGPAPRIAIGGSHKGGNFLVLTDRQAANGSVVNSGAEENLRRPFVTQRFLEGVAHQGVILAQLRFGLGFDKAALDDLIKIEADTLANFVNVHPRQRKCEVMMTSYLIVDLDIHNPEGLQEYQNNVPSFIAAAPTQQ